jgi:hypothetical protein
MIITGNRRKGERHDDNRGGRKTEEYIYPGFV